MCNFKKHPDEETDEEDAISVENIIFPNVDEASDDEEAVEVDLEIDRGLEAVAGPSSDRSDSDQSEDSSDSSGSSSDESEEDDSVIGALKAARKKVKSTPPDIVLSDHITDISFHPQKNILAVASVTGDVMLYKYTLERCNLISTIENHTKACRAVEYGDDGRTLFTLGKDNAIMVTDTATNKLDQFYEKAHDDAPYSLHIINSNTFATGDEGGTIKLWDIRQKPSICQFKVGDEVISNIITDAEEKFLVCTACDSIASFDLPSRKFMVQSEQYDTEFTTMCILKRGTKLAVGTIQGAMYIFNWGQFGYHSDIYPGYKENITSSLAVTEQVVVLGSGDGAVRAASLFPHKPLGVVGHHKLSVEAIDIAYDAQYVASCGFDETVKFWDIEYFEELKIKAEKTQKRDMQRNLPSSNVRNPEDFFAGLS